MPMVPSSDDLRQPVIPSKGNSKAETLSTNSVIAGSVFSKNNSVQKARLNMSALANSAEIFQGDSRRRFIPIPRVCQGAASWQELSNLCNILHSNYRTWKVTVDLATDWCSCLSDSVFGLSYCFKTSLSSSTRDSLRWHLFSELNTKQPPHWVYRIRSNYQQLGDQEARTCKKQGWIVM